MVPMIEIAFLTLLRCLSGVFNVLPHKSFVHHTASVFDETSGSNREDLQGAELNIAEIKLTNLMHRLGYKN